MLSVLQGAGVLLAVAAAYGYALMHASEPAARAMAFATIIMVNVGLILVNRSREKPLIKTVRTGNWALWSVIGGALTALALVLYVPYLSDLFQVAPLSPGQLGVALTAAVGGLIWFEGYKMFRARAVIPDVRT